MTNVLELLHSSSGLTWIILIPTTTMLVRSLTTLPITLSSISAIQKRASLSPLVQAWRATLERTHENDEIIKDKTTQLYKTFGCSRWINYTGFVTQFSIFVGMSLTIRDLVGMPLPFLEQGLPAVGLQTQGMLWFTDLTLADPTLMTPLMIGGLHLINIELNPLMDTQRYPWTTRVFRGFGLLSVLVATQVPMAINIYWLSSALFSLVQNVYLYFRFFRNRPQSQL